MNKDYFLSPSLVTFESFDEVLAAVDQLIDSHSKALAKYEDKLGVLLRGSDGDSRGVHFDHDITNIDAGQEIQKNDKRKKSSGSSDGSEQGWLILESEETTVKVASGNVASVTGKQVEALFKVIESLKAKLASLERIRKLLSDLPAQGFKPNQRVLVMMRDGLPRQIIPSFEAAKVQKKFAYSDQFDIQVLA